MASLFLLQTRERALNGKAKLKIKIEKFYDINFYIFPKKQEIKNQYCACVCMYLYIYMLYALFAIKIHIYIYFIY
jgi:hypothetical protein